MRYHLILAILRYHIPGTKWDQLYCLEAAGLRPQWVTGQQGDEILMLGHWPSFKPNAMMSLHGYSRGDISGHTIM
jgi:hypothetical protein